MGHRANFVLVQDGKAVAFRDSWAALACTLGLEEGALRLKRVVPKLYEPTDELMEWAFAEGGFLIDYDEKVCIAFGYPDVDLEDMPEEHQDGVREGLEALNVGWPAFVTHIEQGWRGFTMVWDGRGVEAFALHLKKRAITSIDTSKASHPASQASHEPEVVVVPKAARRTKKIP